MASGGKTTKFTKEEIQFMKDNYLSMNNEELSKKLGRSVAGINKVKRENNLQTLKIWTDEEKQYLIDNYNILTDLEIAENLQKSIMGVRGQAKNLGIRNKSTAKQWNDKDIAILIDNYNKIPIEEIGAILDRDVISIKNKAFKLNLTNTCEKWTEEEIKTLVYNYSSLSQEELIKLLPNRDGKTIASKSTSLGLYKDTTIKWTKNQLAILENSADKTLKEIANLVGLDEDVVHRKMYKLQLPFVKYGRNQTREDLLNKTNIKHYRERYGIILNENKVFDTYTEEEWVDMYVNKKISNIPKVIYDDKDRYFKCLKYFISKFIDINNRDNILDLDSHFKPNGLTLIQNYAFKNYSSVNDFLIELFSEYNIKQWEFKMVKKQYFDDINNVKEYITHIICDELQCDLNNCSEYIKYFTDNNLVNLGFARVVWIKKSHKYKNYYDLLYTLYGNLIKEECFNYCIASDGIQLDSNEELQVYEFIKNNITSKIKATNRNRKNAYVNNGEMYIPDFSIPCQDKNKKIIIEYFGLYNEKYQQHKIIKTYTDKAKRKIEYFKSLDNVLFVDLYREDLKNNFEGVRNKLTSFCV
jgi:hypothetical protein